MRVGRLVDRLDFDLEVARFHRFGGIREVEVELVGRLSDRGLRSGLFFLFAVLQQGFEVQHQVVFGLGRCSGLCFGRTGGRGLVENQVEIRGGFAG